MGQNTPMKRRCVGSSPAKSAITIFAKEGIMGIFTEHLEDQRDRLQNLLQQVLDDATGDMENKKRVWPIRAALYREIAKELGKEPKEDMTGV